MRKNLPICTAGCMLFTSLWLRKVYDRDRLPRRGKMVIVCNHSSLLDGPLLNAWLNWLRNSATPTIAYEEPLKNPFFGYIMRSGRIIGFDRRDPQSIEKMLRTALGWLNMHHPVMLFPEGHLNDGKTMRLPRPGAALLALESGAPILPMGLRNTAQVLPPGGKLAFPKLRRSVTLHIGKLIDTAALSEEYHAAEAPRRKELIEELSGAFMREMAALSGQELHRRMR